MAMVCQEADAAGETDAACSDGAVGAEPELVTATVTNLRGETIFGPGQLPRKNFLVHLEQALLWRRPGQVVHVLHHQALLTDGAELPRGELHLGATFEERLSQEERDWFAARIAESGWDEGATALRRFAADGDEDGLDDPVVMELALTLNGSNLRFASPRVQNDHRLVLIAVSHGSDVLQYASEELRNDREIVCMAVQRHSASLMHASEALRSDRRIVLQAVAHRGDTLRYAGAELQVDRDIVRRALETDLASGDLYTFQFPEALGGDRELMLMAVAIRGGALAHASEALRGDREVVLRAVTSWGLALQYADECLRGDREVVRAAVEQDAAALEHALAPLRDDADIVLSAVKNGSRALGWASCHLKADREFMERAMDLDRSCVWYASPLIRAELGSGSESDFEQHS